MQITSKNGVTKVTLLQAEERWLRNAAYMIRLAGKTLEIAPGIPDLEQAARALMWLVQEGSRGGNREKLDKQDAMTPEVPVAGPVLSEERGTLGK